jgi:anti-anti-sigma factor
MEITTETNGDALIVRPEGRIDSITSREFEAQLMPHCDRAGPVVIDCSKLTYVSSAGLRVFLMAAKKAKASGGKIVICCLTQGVEEVFVVSGFSKIIEMHKTLEEATG